MHLVKILPDHLTERSKFAKECQELTPVNWSSLEHVVDVIETRGGWRLHVSCVPMREQNKKTMREVLFRAGQCAALSSFRVGKCYFYRKRVWFFFTILQKVAEVRE